MSGFISDGTFFLRPDPYTTILSLGNASVPITVTSYNPTDESLYLNASRGFNRIGEIKPDIAAPGVNIIAPTIYDNFAPFTGTSTSAAHTTGIAALLLEWGIVKNNMSNMSTLTLKNFMIRGAKRSGSILYPNRDWGYGILDIFSIFESLKSKL
jgi:hypothetical protein